MRSLLGTGVFNADGEKRRLLERIEGLRDLRPSRSTMEVRFFPP